jgi:MoaA/NifB/PqqE/SkfB family radical SAM enzyme
MTIIDELKAKYPPDLVDQKLEEWKIQHPGESLEKLRVYLTNRPNDNTSTFVLRVSYLCNNKCIHCFNEDEKKKLKEPKLEELLKVLDGVDKEELIIVTGGEPTLRKDFLDLLKYIKAKGKFVILQSNGMKFSDEKYVEEIVPYLYCITLPIHSSNYDVFDSITQVKGSAEKVVTALKNLVKTNVNITSQTVINRLNYKTLLDTFDMIRDIAPNIEMMLTFPHPISSAHSTNVVPRFSEIRDEVQKVVKKHYISSHYIPKCVHYPYQSSPRYLDKNDDGSLYKPGFEYTDYFVNYGILRAGSRIKTTNCKNCIFNDECLGVWKEYGELYPDPDLEPIYEN